MTSPRSHRKLSAVLAADVVGYTLLMEADEDETHARLMRLRTELLDPSVVGHNGRVVKNTGDGFLAAFDTAHEAARYAISMQTQLANDAADFPPGRRIVFRMGINLCETIVELDDIFGEGVNIAARLMSYAEPGDLVLTEGVAQMVSDVLIGHPTFDMGDLHLKNITRPVRAIGVRIGSSRDLAAPTLRRPTDARPSIAILPFATQLLDPLDKIFADGIVEEITHALAGVRDLIVISRGSTLHFSDERLDGVAVGRELSVGYLLNGSVRRLGDRLRISTKLSEAETDRIVRTDRHEGRVDDIFELQAQIAMTAITAIAPNIEEWELRRAMRKHPESITAYDLVLQARRELYKLDYASHSRARGLLQQAITLDPDYAPVYSYMAYWHIFRVGEGWSADPDADAVEAARVARAAIDRDSNDALALAIYGHVQSFLLRDYSVATLFLERAISAGPNCAPAWSLSSLTCGFLGDGETAVRRAEHGLRLSPLDGHVFWYESTLAQAHYVNGHYEAAAAWAYRANARNAVAMFNHRLLAASLSALGRMTEARQVASELLDQHPDFHLDAYKRRCPFSEPVLEAWIGRLRAAGLPD